MDYRSRFSGDLKRRLVRISIRDQSDIAYHSDRLDKLNISASLGLQNPAFLDGSPGVSVRLSKGDFGDLLPRRKRSSTFIPDYWNLPPGVVSDYSHLF
jgi:hypothetical protein